MKQTKIASIAFVLVIVSSLSAQTAEYDHSSCNETYEGSGNWVTACQVPKTTCGGSCYKRNSGGSTVGRCITAVFDKCLLTTYNIVITGSVKGCIPAAGGVCKCQDGNGTPVSGGVVKVTACY